MNIQVKNIIPAPLQNFSDASLLGSDFEIKGGSRNLITAPSGKGKTTLLMILYGIRTDYTGQIIINGKETRELSRNEWAAFRQKTVSIVFQDLKLFNELTGLENILLKSRLTDYCSTDAIQEMCTALGIGEIMHKKTQEMSLGEMQRVAIIRALVQPFDWLLLDEPFSHLDDDNSMKACALILQESEKRGAGLIITSLSADNFFDYHTIMRI